MKYYTPKSELEFLPKMEFQTNFPRQLTVNTWENNWETKFYPYDWLSDYSKWYSEQGSYKDLDLTKRIRVECLNVEHIKQCNFKENEISATWYRTFKKEISISSYIGLELNPENGYIFIYYQKDKIRRSLFRGILNNKTEFEFILNKIEYKVAPINANYMEIPEDVA